VAVTTRSSDVNAPLFDRAAILDHLTELNTALAQQHAERVDLLVVGGSYLALRGLRAGTRDIDTAHHLDRAAKLAIAAVAEQRSLSAHWLNDSARPFLPADFNDARAEVVAVHSHLTVRVPNPDDVFLMKLNASRGEGDLADLIRLWPTCSFENAREVVGRYATAYPHEEPDPDLETYVAERIIATSGPR
jgi:hypothetical protein